MRKIILTLGLFLVGGAATLAQEMRMPLNADQVKWALLRMPFRQAHKSPSFPGIRSKTAFMSFD